MWGTDKAGNNIPQYQRLLQLFKYKRHDTGTNQNQCQIAY